MVASRWATPAAQAVVAASRDIGAPDRDAAQLGSSAMGVPEPQPSALKPGARLLAALQAGTLRPSQLAARPTSTPALVPWPVCLRELLSYNPHTYRPKITAVSGQDIKGGQGLGLTRLTPEFRFYLSQLIFLILMNASACLLVLSVNGVY